MLLALAAGLALGRMLPPDWSVIVSLALFSWLAASWFMSLSGEKNEHS